MRFKLLMLSFLLSIAFLAAIAICVDWDNPESQSVDEMLSSGEYSTYNSNIPGQAATPKAERERQKNKSSMSWTMPSTLTGGGDSAKSSRDQAETTSSEAVEDDMVASTIETTSAADTAATTQSELPPSESIVASVSGSWSFTLMDSVQRDLALVLYQPPTGDEIFGAGKIRADNNTLDVAVSGFATNETMDLDVISLGTIGLYRLELDLSKESAAGDYQAFYTSGDSMTGSAEGIKTA
jgi:hypothetical protein